MPASLSYSCDSPFFAKRSSHCDQDLEKLAEFLRTLTVQMKQFCREAQTLARTAEGIGIHMKSGLGATAGSSLLPVLACFGDIFTEIAGAQEILAESLDRSFTTPLDRFCNEDVLSVHQLRNQYLAQREQNESIISRYLQSDLANFGRGTTQSHLDIRAHEVVRQTKRFESVRYDLVRKINEMEARKSFEVAESCVAGILSLRTFHHTCMDRLLASNSFIEELRSQQQRDRAAFEVSMRPLDRKRHDISAVLDAMVERVEMASAFLQTDMSTAGAGGSGAVDTSVAGMLLDYAGAGPSAAGSSQDPSSSNAFSRIGAFMGGLTASAKGASQSTRKSITEDAPPTALCEECEARMKALDHSELVPFFNVRPDEEPAGAVKQGYLWRRVSRKVMDTWERRWFILDDSKMYYVSDSDDVHRIQVVCELMLANIRELKNYEVPFCFEIAFANFKTTIVQAEGTKEYAAWIQALRSGIEKSLVSGRPSAGPGNPAAANGPGGGEAAGANYTMTAPTGASSASRRTLMRPVIDKILANSPLCAECDRPGPEWVSLNIGCLVCIDCSGVHRSMGVHISKMRSLTLDDLEPAEYAMLLSMGNTMTNSIWEKELDARGAEKPTVRSHYMTRDVFIRAKYQYKAFLSNPPVCIVDPLNATLLPPPANVVLWDRDVATKALCKAVAANDMYGVVRALAADADVSGGLSISAEEQLKVGDTSPLMLAIRSGSLEAAVLLIVNGASLTQEAARSDSSTPLEAALTLAPKLPVEMDPVALHELHGTEAISAYILNKAEQGARLGGSYSPVVGRAGPRKRVEETTGNASKIRSKDDSADVPRTSSLGPGTLTMKAKQFITRSSSPHMNKPSSPVLDSTSSNGSSGPARYRGASDFGAMPPTSPGVRARSKSNGDELDEGGDLTTNGVADNISAAKKAVSAPGSSKISQKMRNAFSSTDFLFPHDYNGQSSMYPASEPREIFHQPCIHKIGDTSTATRSVPGRVSSPEDSNLIRSIGTRPHQNDSSRSPPAGK